MYRERISWRRQLKIVLKVIRKKWTSLAQKYSDMENRKYDMESWGVFPGGMGAGPPPPPKKEGNQRARRRPRAFFAGRGSPQCNP